MWHRLRDAHQDLEQKYRHRIEELQAGLATARQTIEAQQAELMLGLIDVRGRRVDAAMCAKVERYHMRIQKSRHV